MALYKRLSVAALLSVLAIVRAEPPTNKYLPPSNNGYNYDRPQVPFPPAPRPTPFVPAPAPAPQPTYGGGAIQPSYDQGEHHDHGAHEPGMPYDFQYAVKDDYYGTDYSRNEVSDGNTITGEYRVQLPDGRLQIVRYTADWQHGYNADVTYEGEAKYPDPPKSGGGQLGTYGPPQQQPSNGGYQYKK